MASPTNRHVTVVRNISGATRFFGYIGPRGTEIANGADVEVPGNLFDLLAKDKRVWDAFIGDLTNNRLEVLATPTIIAHDGTANIVRELTIDNGSVVVSHLSYGSYYGSAPNI